MGLVDGGRGVPLRLDLPKGEVFVRSTGCVGVLDNNNNTL